MLMKFTLVSLEAIEKSGWTFKVSGNDYEKGILILAVSDDFSDTRIKYFYDSLKAKEWIDDLVFHTN